VNGAILIVARNNLHLTKVAVNSALAQDVPCTVLVIDNASTDGTSMWLRSKRKIAVITYQHQRSLAACWNAGIKDLFIAGADRVLVANNDVYLRPDTYSMLSAHGGPFVTCVSVDSMDRIGKAGDRGIEALKEMERPHPDFSCFMISKSVINQVGPFDYSYFPAYCEDADMHVRLHRAGIRAVCIDLPFYHAAAQTVKTADEGERARIQRGADANREKFRLKYGCVPGSKEYENLFL
jgi:GT2 family glycosyltransferase